MKTCPSRLFRGLGFVGIMWLVTRDPAWAQAHNPFSVGISEGGGSATGLSGWLVAEQAKCEQWRPGAVRASNADGSALWLLAGLSFLYGVFHAAGPGHGKAVVASYMFANERALKRGMIISFLAAALQGLVAIALVGILAMVFHATAQRMKDTAQVVESLSYAGIALLGLWLVWSKGRGFVTVWRLQRASHPVSIRTARATGTEHAPHAHGHDCGDHGHEHVHDHVAAKRRAQAEHVHGPGCGHFHAPDPKTLGDRFSWTSALMTVAAAGLRPCSGAILVLVFALAQGIFAAGVYATLAMSLGTAITTSGLASLAVLAGGLAVRIFGEETARGNLVVRGIEVVAGVFILLLGLGLFFGINAASGA